MENERLGIKWNIRTNVLPGNKFEHYEPYNGSRHEWRVVPTGRRLRPENEDTIVKECYVNFIGDWHFNEEGLKELTLYPAVAWGSVGQGYINTVIDERFIYGFYAWENAKCYNDRSPSRLGTMGGQKPWVNNIMVHIFRPHPDYLQIVDLDDEPEDMESED